MVLCVADVGTKPRNSDAPLPDEKIIVMENPFNGWADANRVMLVPAITTDVTIIHVQKADALGNARIAGLSFADVLTKKGLSNVSAESTGGSVENCNLVGRGRAEMGFAMAGVCYDAFNGQGKFKERGKLPIMAAYPYYSSVIVTASSYGGTGGITEDMPAVGVQNVLVCRKDLPEDLVYNMVKTIFESQKKLLEVHQVASQMNLNNSVKSPIDLHPGAVKCFREKGIL